MAGRQRFYTLACAKIELQRLNYLLNKNDYDVLNEWIYENLLVLSEALWALRTRLRFFSDGFS